MDIQCHCGEVKIRVPHLPGTLNRCSCSICKRYGALWGYYAPDTVQISGPTDTYVWGDRMIAFHRCQNCGVVTHWANLDKNAAKMGVNMQIANAETIAGIPERDGHAQKT